MPALAPPTYPRRPLQALWGARSNAKVLAKVLSGVLPGVLGLGASACFFEPTPPSSFRVACSVSTDCSAPQICANELCVQPCGVADAEPCPQDAPVCFNGYCSSLCPTNEDICPGDQECVPLTADDDETGEIGICGEFCSSEDDCPGDDVCIMGGCLTPCMDQPDCEADEVCTMGVCLPSG